MGLFEKFKRTKDASRQQAPVLTPAPNTTVAVLFDRADIEIKEIEAAITEQFGAGAVLSVDSSPSVANLMLCIDGINMMCSYMPFPLPKEEADIPALLGFNHYISEEEQRALAEHRSFCLLTEIGGGKNLADKRGVCLALTKLCGGVLKMECAAGVYYSAAQLLLGKSMYLNYASISEREEKDPAYFPAMLWVLVYQTRADDGAPTIETCGLEQFGFLELVFYKPTEEWACSFEKLYLMSTFQITGKEVYKNMDTICFTQDSMSIIKQRGRKLAVIGGI